MEHSPGKRGTVPHLVVLEWPGLRKESFGCDWKVEFSTIELLWLGWQCLGGPRRLGTVLLVWPGLGSASPLALYGQCGSQARTICPRSSFEKAAIYLVDPASSHMLVSKIKPCMSKYILLHSETANGSLDQLWFLRSYNPTWITVVILELIHASKLRPSGKSAFIRSKPIGSQGSYRW